MCRFETDRSGAVRLVAVLLFVALCAGTAWAKSAKVTVAEAGVAPRLFSPGTHDGILDETVLHAALEVKAVAGIRSAQVRGGKGDMKTFLVRWEWIITDVHGNEMTAIAGVGDLLSGGEGVRPASLPKRGHVQWAEIEASWDGSVAGGGVAADGNYPYEVWAAVVRVDVLGNGRAREHLIDFVAVHDGVLIVDSTPPAISIGEVPDCTASPVTPVVQVDDPHLDEVTVTLDGEPYVEGTAISAEGEHTLRVEATDRAGNRAVAERSFIIDWTDPVISVTGVEDGETVGPGAVLYVDVEEPNLTVLTILLDGEPYESGTPVEEPGEHVLTVHAEDCAGNAADASVSFQVEAASEPVDVLFFVNVDDPGLARVPTGSSGSADLFGNRSPDGLATSVDAVAVHSRGRPSWLRFGDQGRVDRIETPDGSLRLDIAWLDPAGVQVTLVDTTLALQSSAVFGMATAPAAAPASFRLETPRLLDMERMAPGRLPSFGAVGDPVEMSVIPVSSSSSLLAPAVAAAVSDGTCAAPVVASTCGVPLDDPRIQVSVTPSDDGLDSYAVPASLLGYALACETAPVADENAYCGSVASSAGSACASVAALQSHGFELMCAQLTAQLGQGETPLSPGERAHLSGECEGLLSMAATTCDALEFPCSGASLPETQDRRTTSPLYLDAEVVSDAVGTVTTGDAADGTGPFPPFTFVHDDEVVITHLRPEFVDGEFFEIIGRVACAPAGTVMTYEAELCDFDASGCFPYTATGEADGTGEIGFRFTGRYGFDQVSVTFSVEGGPSRKVVVTF